MTMVSSAPTTICGERRRRLFSTRRVVMLGLLTASWCALWRDISVANVAAGFVIAVAVLATGVGTPSAGRIALLPLTKLIWIVFLDLVKSTFDVAKEIITPGDTTDEAIVAVAIAEEGRHHFLLLIVAVTLTPGTAVVDADPDAGTLYLHLLHAERRGAVTEHVNALTTLACQALPIPAADQNLGKRT